MYAKGLLICQIGIPKSFMFEADEKKEREYFIHDTHTHTKMISNWFNMK